MEIPLNFDRAIDGLSKVTLRGGVVGKVTFAVALVSVALALIAWSASNVWVSAAALVMVFTLAIVLLWRLINFADRNPQAALLEGAEFLVHQQMVHVTKELPSLPHSQLEQVQPEPIEGPAADSRLAQLPDQTRSAPPSIEGNG